MLLFSVTVSAKGVDEKTVLNNENVISVNLDGVILRDAKIVADYESDFADLLQQLIDYDSQYSNLVDKYNNEIDPEKREVLSKIIDIIKQRLEEETATLLQERYPKSKFELSSTLLKEHQQQKSNITPLASIDSTWNKGDYGTSSTTGIGSTASYSHAINFNRAYVYVSPSFFTGSATAISGIQVAPTENQTATVKINSVTAKATVSCATDNSYANYTLDAIIYNPLFNQVVRSQQVASEGCTLEYNLKYLDLNSTTVNFYNVPLVAFNGARVYLRAYADVYYGFVYSGVDQGGAKWGTIQVY
jgi:hypothetical protein